jgi:hypothetical protein
MRQAIHSGILAGALALAGGALVLGTTLAQAILQEPIARPVPSPGLDTMLPAAVPAAEPATVPSPAEHPVSAEYPAPARTQTDRMVREAANRAPFDPQRRPPTQRYQLPGGREMTAPAPPEQPPVPPLRVLGTITMPGGGIAVIQAEGESPRVVAVGQMIGAYRLASVKEESVVVSSRGWDISLALEEGKAAAAQSDERPGPGNRRGAMGNQNLQQQLDALRARLGSDAQIQVEGGRVFIVRPDGTRQEVQLPGLIGRGARGSTIPPELQTGQGVGEGMGGGGK